MTHSRMEIHFDSLADRQARARDISYLIIPRDRFTQQLVTRGVSVRLPRFSADAKRALSGVLFFEDLPEAPPYTVEFDATAAGYLPVHDAVIGVDAKEEVLLDLAPEQVPDGETAVLRGQVKRGDTEIVGAEISGSVAQPDGGTIEYFTHSGVRGAFALRVLLGKTTVGGASIPLPLTAMATITARFDGVENTSPPIEITDMRTAHFGRIELPV